MSGPIGDRDGGGEHLADRSPNLAIVVVNFGSHLLLSENLASIDLAGLDAGAIGESFGDWTLNGGVTYFFTNDQITVNNGEDNFLTASLGLALAF